MGEKKKKKKKGRWEKKGNPRGGQGGEMHVKTLAKRKKRFTNSFLGGGSQIRGKKEEERIG